MYQVSVALQDKRFDSIVFVIKLVTTDTWIRWNLVWHSNSVYSSLYRYTMLSVSKQPKIPVYIWQLCMKECSTHIYLTVWDLSFNSDILPRMNWGWTSTVKSDACYGYLYWQLNFKQIYIDTYINSWFLSLHYTQYDSLGGYTLKSKWFPLNFSVIVTPLAQTEINDVDERRTELLLMQKDSDNGTKFSVFMQTGLIVR